MGLIKELWEFMKLKKKFWLTFIIIIFLLLGAVLLFTETSIFSPLIYTVF
ncbi:MAG TPA: DUF5989 family protein [Nitrospiria bacterium]|nr:DUF5989 family protein [Nitrospiria bacterium]